MLMKNVMLILFLANANTLLAQENDTVKVEKPAGVPVVSYSSPKEYTIAGIEVTGCKDYDDFVLIGFSGLSVGDVISVPGSQITDAVKRYWKHGLFSDVKISASRIEDDKIWLEIHLEQRPRVSQVNYNGIKKSEREDLESRLQLKKGHQITPNLADRAKLVIQKYFEGKGFKNVDVEINQTDDLSHEGQVIVDVNIDKNEKVKIRKISFRGNEALTDSELKKAMKKTNEKFNLSRDFKSSLLEIFATKKFTAEEYEKDKKNIISKYNEMGYRDAVLTADTIRNVNDKTVDIDIRIEEGRKYYLKGITFVGNTHYSTDFLTGVLNMKAGEELINGCSPLDCRSSRLICSTFHDILYYGNSFWEHLQHLIYLIAYGTIRQWTEMWEEYTFIKPRLMLNDEKGEKVCKAIEEYIIALKSNS